MGKKFLTMSLVLVMVLSFTACAEEASTQEIVDGVIVSWAGVRTYQFDMDMTVDMAGEAKGEVFESTMTMDFSGALDVENRQMKADITVNVTVPEEDEVEMEMYLIADMLYMMIDVSVMGPMWVKSEVPEGYWEEMSLTEGQIDLLETAQVKVIGSETVRGVDCYVLQITPDVEQLWQLAMQQAQVSGREVPDVTEEFVEEMFRSFSVKQWIAKDTYFLTKAEIDMDMELAPEALGFPEEEGILNMTYTISLLAYDYNQPVSIVLPPEAEEAVEMPMR